MDLEIAEFRMSLEKYISDTNLPVEVKRIVLEKIYSEISAESRMAISAELDEREKERGGAGQNE